MVDQSSLAGLLSAIDATSAGFTFCELSVGVGLLGTVFDGVSAYQVLSGTLHMGGVGGEPLVAREGWLVLVPAGVRPVLAADANSVDPARAIDGQRCFGRSARGWMVADATREGRRDLVVAAARIMGTGKTSLATAVALPVKHSAAGRHAVALLRDEFARSEGSQALAASLMSACITLGLRGAIEGFEPGAPPRPDRREELIARAVDAMAARPSDPHCVDSLAQLAGMSRATFVRQFARHMGTSPMEYLQRRRLKEAAAMLRSTDLPVKSIAASTGFVSSSHFSRAFSGVYGQDPSSYRLAEQKLSSEPPLGAAEAAAPSHA